LRAFELWQVSENFHRSNLPQRDRNKLRSRWVELVGEEGGQLAHPTSVKKNAVDPTLLANSA